MEKVFVQHATRESSPDDIDGETPSVLRAGGVTLRAMDRCDLRSPRRGATPSWMNYDHIATQTVNMNEMMSLRALISYVASISGRTEFGIERDFSNHFRIPNTKCLPASDYDAAVRYLVDLVPEVQSGTA